MKVSNITLQAVCNYGSVLQTYATEHIFNELGLEAETLNYVRKSAKINSIRGVLANKEAGIVMRMKQLILLPTSRKQRKVFDEFLNKYLHLSPVCYTEDSDFENNPPEADIFCTGSDQVWNSGWHAGIPKHFYLSFVPDGKKKIAFSASFGKEALDESEKAETKALLSRYDAISVREKSGVDILNDLGLTGTWVPDPTVVAGREFWEKTAVPRMIKEDYILVYQLGRSKQFNDYLRAYAKKRGLKLVRVCMRYDHALLPGKSIVIPSPEEVLSLFRYASCVVTDSFHATAFSLIFHRQFICIYPKRFSARLDSILELTGLSDRKLTSMTDYSIGEKPIDYDRVDRILEKERNKALSFLKNAIYGD